MVMKKKLAFVVGVIVLIISSVFVVMREARDVKIVLVRCGVGNQMFQYAFGEALRKITGADVVYKLATPIVEVPHTLVSIRDKFNVKMKIVDDKYIESLKPKIIDFPNSRYYSEIALHEKGNVFYIGNFETIKWFLSIKKQLLKDFSLKIPLDKPNEKMMKKVKSTNSVSIHVRRGDFNKEWKNRKHYMGAVCLGAKYYHEAINYVVANVENTPHFFCIFG
jgi:hypothetical protein